ncbi:DUF2624 domain-containing protein [Bacillaceae bacterium SIJ1]|uniref:DUF2624 family protein n=1 Tax=Litoribacterium kuwaitense TaxID=1398745 RepID=UPI0013ED867E|nr:DUF2624 family protein [Litoribacterium kuwaitense]NGP43539.1 DUF2624 domain-containing protein [Litoribacterium kuwaitense]
MIIQNIVNQKVKNLTTNELLKYAKKYDFSINRQQADSIINILKKEPRINIFDTQQRRRLIYSIEQETDPKTAQQLNQLLDELLNKRK